MSDEREINAASPSHAAIDNKQPSIQELITALRDFTDNYQLVNLSNQEYQAEARRYRERMLYLTESIQREQQLLKRQVEEVQREQRYLQRQIDRLDKVWNDVDTIKTRVDGMQVAIQDIDDRTIPDWTADHRKNLQRRIEQLEEDVAALKADDQQDFSYRLERIEQELAALKAKNAGTEYAG